MTIEEQARAIAEQTESEHRAKLEAEGRHIRIGVRVGGRRIGDFKGDGGSTLCGAPVASLDLPSVRDLGTGRWFAEHGGCRDCMRIAHEKHGARLSAADLPPDYVAAVFSSSVAREIWEKLNENQRDALLTKPDPDGTLRTGLGRQQGTTMRALARRGLVVKAPRPGLVYGWRLTTLGEDVAAYGRKHSSRSRCL